MELNFINTYHDYPSKKPYFSDIIVLSKSNAQQGKREMEPMRRVSGDDCRVTGQQTRRAVLDSRADRDLQGRRSSADVREGAREEHCRAVQPLSAGG